MKYSNLCGLKSFSWMWPRRSGAGRPRALQLWCQAATPWAEGSLQEPFSVVCIQIHITLLMTGGRNGQIHINKYTKRLPSCTLLWDGSVLLLSLCIQSLEWKGDSLRQKLSICGRQSEYREEQSTLLRGWGRKSHPLKRRIFENANCCSYRGQIHQCSALGWNQSVGIGLLKGSKNNWGFCFWATQHRVNNWCQWPKHPGPEWEERLCATRAYRKRLAFHWDSCYRN